MDSYYRNSFYTDQNTINYTNLLTQSYIPSQTISYKSNNNFNTMAYATPSAQNQYITNTTPYLPETQNYLYTQPIPFQYNINDYFGQNNYNYAQNIPYKKEYQTSTAYKYNEQRKPSLYPIKRIYTNTAVNNNMQILNNPGRNTVHYIKRVNTSMEKPNRPLLYKMKQKRNYSSDYRYSDTSEFNNDIINSIKTINKGNYQNQTLYDTNNNSNNAIDIENINKENNKAFNELMKLTDNSSNSDNNYNYNYNQTTSENIYSFESYNNTQYNNNFTNDDITSINSIPLIKRKENILTQSAHFTPSSSLNKEFFFNESINNNTNNIKLEDNNNSEYINKNNTNNVSININEFFGTQNALKPKTEIKIVSQPHSSFIKNMNGEIISNSNSQHYFRKLDGNLVKSYGYCQNQGKRNYMEDEGKVIENLNGDINKILFGLFDGHGGGQVSKFLQEHIGDYMKKILNLDKSNYVENFTKIFKNIDEDIESLHIPTVGSTGTIVYIEKKDNKRILYCVNVGDTRCVLVNKNKVTRLSYDHRVADSKENQRILKDQGIIINNRVYGILMLSRSFGDFITKGFGVIVVPYITRIELCEDDIYCVIASDGVWDVVKDEDCSVLIKMGLNSGELSRRIINEGLKRKSKDNLSCFVIRLN